MRAAALGLLGLLSAPALAQPQAYPHVATEVDLGLYTVGTLRGPAAQRGASTYLFGEVAAGLHLAPGWSLQGVLAFEPIGEGDSTGGSPADGAVLFRRQAAFLEALFLEWKPEEGVMLQAGRFVAPFGRGHHDFPGILPRVRAHEVSLIGDSLGLGGSLRAVESLEWGTHEVSAAVFTLDRSLMSSTLLTRPACCDERYERYRRNTARQGGPGNTGQFDNAALALDGDGIAWLPSFSYHLGVVTRGAGQDGTAREWGYAAGLRQEIRWAPDRSTLLFAEGIQFRGAGGRPRTTISSFSLDPDTGDEVETLLDTTVSERLTFTTLGLRHRIGEWRGTLAWQRAAQKRSVDPVPNANWIEASVGRDIGGGFALDVGYQYARGLREDTGRPGDSHALLLRLGWSTH
jgi:hypothetical protein